MKRHKDYLREVERSSTLLMNLDSGLISLKRAMSDKEVFRSYELMNITMKSIRQDFDVSHVEDVMAEYEDLNNEFHSLHEAINLDSQGHQDTESDELLLKELSSLTIDEVQKSVIDESRGVCSDPLSDKELRKETPSGKDQDKKENLVPA
jgi:hypothetical protein